MKNWRLKEAFELQQNKGKSQIDLAVKLWPKTARVTQAQSLIKLKNGTYGSVKHAHVPIICKYLGVDANFLFGIKF